MVDMDEPPHTGGNQTLVRRLERDPLQAPEQGPTPRPALKRTQTPVAAAQQQHKDQTYPNPFRVCIADVGHSSAAARASSVGGRCTACCGKRSSRSRLSGTVTALPMMGATISLHFGG